MTDMAKKLANPVANLISVPLQYNHDEYGGLNDGATVSRLVAQPVIPFKLNETGLLITRTLIPFVDQTWFHASGIERIRPRRHRRHSVLIAGQRPHRSLIWGAGCRSAATVPTDALGTGKLSVGRAVLLKQSGP